MTARLRMLREEAGAEIIQLAVALPLLIGLFGLSAQVAIWVFSGIQFADAAESAAYQVDLEAITAAGTESSTAKELLADEIARRMIGTDASALEVSDITATTSAKAQSTPIAGEEASALLSQYTCADTTGTLSFTARYRCPSLLSLGNPLVIERHLVRDRLVSRTAEVE